MTQQSRVCWCPCKCGCEEPYYTINVSGLCPDCENGNHEVPPEGVKLDGREATERLAELHEEVAAKFRNVLRARKKCEELTNSSVKCRLGENNYNLTGNCEFNHDIQSDKFFCVFCGREVGWE